MPIRSNLPLALASTITALVALAGSAAAQSSFKGIGILPGGNYSTAYGLSGNGQVVVGTGTVGANWFPLRYSAGTGLQNLGTLAGLNNNDQWAIGASFDGSVIVGQSLGLNGKEAFRWTQGSGMTGLGDLALPQFWSAAYSCSANGSIIYGFGDYQFTPVHSEAFRWTQGTGIQGLGDLPGGDFYSWIWGCSADGTVAAGAGAFKVLVTPSEYAAVRWTQAGGLQYLGDLPGGIEVSFAHGVSADGNVIVGYGTTAAGHEPFRWTLAGGMVGLGGLPGRTINGQAFDCSGNGSVIVGYTDARPATPTLRTTISLHARLSGTRPTACAICAMCSPSATAWTCTAGT